MFFINKILKLADVLVSISFFKLIIFKFVAKILKQKLPTVLVISVFWQVNERSYKLQLFEIDFLPLLHVSKCFLPKLHVDKSTNDLFRVIFRFTNSEEFLNFLLFVLKGLMKAGLT